MLWILEPFLGVVSTKAPQIFLIILNHSKCIHVSICCSYYIVFLPLSGHRRRVQKGLKLTMGAVSASTSTCLFRWGGGNKLAYSLP